MIVNFGDSRQRRRHRARGAGHEFVRDAGGPPWPPHRAADPVADHPPGLDSERLMRIVPLPLAWGEQRTLLAITDLRRSALPL